MFFKPSPAPAFAGARLTPAPAPAFSRTGRSLPRSDTNGMVGKAEYGLCFHVIWLRFEGLWHPLEVQQLLNIVT